MKQLRIGMVEIDAWVVSTIILMLPSLIDKLLISIAYIALSRVMIQKNLTGSLLMNHTQLTLLI